MPKHKQSRDSAHLFITQALTHQDVNLGVYKDKGFGRSLRLVAIDSILSILQRINSRQLHAQRNGEAFDVMEFINQPHPITGLNMLDYCLAAGFDELAITLVHHGARSKNLQSFRQNVNSTFPDGILKPDIVRDINTIMEGCAEIKHDYDQFVNKTHKVLPKMVSAGKRIYSGYGTPTLIMVGVGGILLAPLLQPLIHSAGATALLVSAGFLPAVISGIYAASREAPPQPNPSQEELENDARNLETLQYLLTMAKSIKSDLQASPREGTTSPIQSRHKKNGPRQQVYQAPKQAPLLLQLSKKDRRKHVESPAEIPHTKRKAYA
jgi:hypothetical protein